MSAKTPFAADVANGTFAVVVSYGVPEAIRAEASNGSPQAYQSPIGHHRTSAPRQWRHGRRAHRRRRQPRPGSPGQARDPAPGGTRRRPRPTPPPRPPGRSQADHHHDRGADATKAKASTTTSAPTTTTTTTQRRPRTSTAGPGQAPGRSGPGATARSRTRAAGQDRPSPTRRTAAAQVGPTTSTTLNETVSRGPKSPLAPPGSAPGCARHQHHGGQPRPSRSGRQLSSPAPR